MINDNTIYDISLGLKEKKFSVLELTEYYLDRVEKLNPVLNSFITVSKDIAIKQAKKCDELDLGLSRYTKDNNGFDYSPIFGIPASLKDLINTKGVKTTCGSKMLKDFVSSFDADCVERLNKAGMVLLGKNNLDEFGCGGSTENSFFGVCKNPWNIENVGGGSSGGSAVAVASDMSVYSLGTDTGGSIRQPASFCGVVGLKPTYGRVSRRGVTAYASSWDVVGPITKTVMDMAIVLSAIAGNDKKDSTSSDCAVPDYVKNIDQPIKGVKIGVLKEFFEDGVNDEVKNSISKVIYEYEKMGAHIKNVSVPSVKYSVAVYYVLTPSELSTNLSRFDGIRFGNKYDSDIKDFNDYYSFVRSDGFGDEVKRRIVLGNYFLSSLDKEKYLFKAQKMRTKIINDFENIFKDVDFLITPSSPFVAPKIGENKNALDSYIADMCTIPANLIGAPALNVPCGFSSDNMPIGFQIIGPKWSEDRILNMGYLYERINNWYKIKPFL